MLEAPVQRDRLDLDLGSIVGLISSEAPYEVFESVLVRSPDCLTAHLGGVEVVRPLGKLCGVIEMDDSCQQLSKESDDARCCRRFC